MKLTSSSLGAMAQESAKPISSAARKLIEARMPWLPLAAESLEEEGGEKGEKEAEKAKVEEAEGKDSAA